MSIEGATLPFVVAVDDDGSAGEKGLFGRADSGAALRQVPIAVLRENLGQVVAGLRSLFDELGEQSGGLALKEAQISFEVTASGGVQLIGVGAHIGRSGAVTLTFGA